MNKEETVNMGSIEEIALMVSSVVACAATSAGLFAVSHWLTSNSAGMVAAWGGIIALAGTGLTAMTIHHVIGIIRNKKANHLLKNIQSSSISPNARCDLTLYVQTGTPAEAEIFTLKHLSCADCAVLVARHNGDIARASDVAKVMMRSGIGSTKRKTAVSAVTHALTRSDNWHRIDQGLYQITEPAA
ncbi:MAG: hypothetical protein OXL37_03555 [Chloroflexota bacterium]|nr:hypothetical protein [Chloroflexota bacterium]MDE2958607.1 hypothetical protein [Chloroflexota bacterium]